MKAGRWHYHRALVEVGGRGGIWGRVGTTTRWRASSTTSLLYSISKQDVAPSQSIRRATTAATAPATEHRGLRKDHFTVNSLLETTLYSTCPENPIQPPLNPPPYSATRHVGITTEMQRDYLKEAIREISIHNSIEDDILLPLVHQLLREGKELAEKVRKSHDEIIRKVRPLHEFLQCLPPNPRDWPYFPYERVSELRKAFMDHVTDQEGTLFPMIEKMLTPEKLEELASDLEDARNTASTEPLLQVARPSEIALDAFAEAFQHPPDAHIAGNIAENTRG